MNEKVINTGESKIMSEDDFIEIRQYFEAHNNNSVASYNEIQLLLNKLKDNTIDVSKDDLNKLITQAKEENSESKE